MKGLGNSTTIAFDVEDKETVVQAYKKAFQKDNTLAAANLAQIYIGKGFYEEAEKVLKEANEKDNVDVNVSKAVTALEQAKETERKQYE